MRLDTELWARYRQDLERQRRSRLTIRTYHVALGKFWGYLSETRTPKSSKAITRETGEKYAVWLRAGGAAHNTETYYLSMLKRFSRWMADALDLPADPLARFKVPGYQPPEIDPLTPAAAAALVREAERTSHPARNRAMLLVMLDTGLRNAELAHLEIGQLKASPELGPHARVLGKGGRWDTVFFSAVTWEAIQRYANLAPQHGGRPKPGSPVLFQSRYGSSISPEAVRQLVRRCGERAGLGHVWPHLLRHSFATSLAGMGVEPFKLRDLMRHRSVRTTERYIHMRNTQLVDAHRQGNILGGIALQPAGQPAPAPVAAPPAPPAPTPLSQGAKLARMRKLRKLRPGGGRVA